MNPIDVAARQALVRSIDLLAAQRQSYSNAKGAMLGQLVLSLGGIAVGLLVAAKPTWTLVGQCVGGVIVAVDLGLGYQLKGYRREGAQLQELFDSEVLGLPWNETLAGDKPSVDLISDRAKAYRKANATLADLEKWYTPEVSVLPQPLAQLACQREGVSWDRRLRKRYAMGLTGVFILLVTLIASAAWTYHAQAGAAWWEILTTFWVFAFPMVKYAWTNLLEAIVNVRGISELQQTADRIWQQLVDREVSADGVPPRIRSLQDRIYDHRRTTPLIHDAVYEYFRKGMQEDVRDVTLRLIEEARQKGWVPPPQPRP